MNKKKKMAIIVILLVATGGILFYLNKRKKDKAKEGGSPSIDPQTQDAIQQVEQKCQAVEEAKGGGKGVYLAIAGGKGTPSRVTASERYKVGQMVSVDGGTPTKIIKVWRDSNKQIGAIKLADGTAKGKQVCIVG